MSREELKAYNIAQQLNVSSTSIRDGLSHFVEDALVHKLPYQGWFVLRYQEPEIRDPYEMRVGVKCFGIRQGCERLTPQELEWLHASQGISEAAEAREDIEACWPYNPEFHTGIIRAAKNSRLLGVFRHFSLKMQMFSGKTNRKRRPSRAAKENRHLPRLMANRNASAAWAVIQDHVLGARQEILRHGLW